MKKNKFILYFILMFVLLNFTLFVLCSCDSHIYNSKKWKIVTLDNVGEFLVPCKWIVTKNDDVLYFTNTELTEENCIIYMIGVLYGNEIEYVSFADLVGGFELIESLDGHVLSNNGYYCERRCLIKGLERKLFFINLYNYLDYEAYFYVFDDSIDEQTVREMANSYKMYIKEF